MGRVVSRPSEKAFAKRRRVSFILQAQRIEPAPLDKRAVLPNVFSAEDEENSPRLQDRGLESTALYEETSSTGEKEGDQSSPPEVHNRGEVPYQEVKGKIWVNSYSLYSAPGYGDRVEVRGRLRVPRSARDQEDFDWQEYLSYQGAWVEIHTASLRVLEDASSSLVGWTHRNEEYLSRLIQKTLPNLHAQVVKSILLGDKEGLPPDVRDSFRRTGTAQAVPVQLG